ncbi:hypothetical protein [Jhaorihella thermophila]|uniref:Uncharacterized protein n=2 Tax=Jhaorihella thermophila TaxID=488547 RepID=A0A1H5YHN1_9RHOB|nr:hypothetical protein [Jhaorihella thermophila]SEG23222.1 hypothetical protein SAMN05421751_11825 [Jhaorihella thermophila]
MSSLSDIDKRYLESLLGMGGGYVLDYNDATFAEFFRRHGVDIHSRKYQTFGTSKAKKLRAFWEREPDALVGKVLEELLEAYVASKELKGEAPNTALLDRCRKIVERLTGKKAAPASDAEAGFLDREFQIPNINRLPVDAGVAQILEARIAEARNALKAGAHLSVIFLCGSVLEGALLGAAQADPAGFNRATCAPKDKTGKVRPFQDWTLAAFIDAACEVGLLSPDVQRFGHGLRDFRNYIHPYQQLLSGFAPDEHTAKVCFQVLKAALADLAGERR